jgi:hypothetical protein
MTTLFLPNARRPRQFSRINRQTDGLDDEETIQILVKQFRQTRATYWGPTSTWNETEPCTDASTENSDCTQILRIWVLSAVNWRHFWYWYCHCVSDNNQSDRRTVWLEGRVHQVSDDHERQADGTAGIFKVMAFSWRYRVYRWNPYTYYFSIKRGRKGLRQSEALPFNKRSSNM